MIWLTFEKIGDTFQPNEKKGAFGEEETKAY